MAWTAGRGTWLEGTRAVLIGLWMNFSRSPSSAASSGSGRTSPSSTSSSSPRGARPVMRVVPTCFAFMNAFVPTLWLLAASATGAMAPMSSATMESTTSKRIEAELRDR